MAYLRTSGFVFLDAVSPLCVYERERIFKKEILSFHLKKKKVKKNKNPGVLFNVFKHQVNQLFGDFEVLSSTVTVYNNLNIEHSDFLLCLSSVYSKNSCFEI